MNQFNIDYDFPGLCCKCHTEIAEFEGSHKNGVPSIKRILPKCDSASFEMDDYSVMKVVLCKDCKDNLSYKDCQEIMESVINGWQDEIERARWEDERISDYMEKYSKKFIRNRHDRIWSEEDASKIKKPRKEKLRLRIKKHKEK